MFGQFLVATAIQSPTWPVVLPGAFRHATPRVAGEFFPYGAGASAE